MTTPTPTTPRAARQRPRRPQSHPHTPGPFTRVTGLVITAITAGIAIGGVVAQELNVIWMLAGVIAGFTVADLTDAARQKTYWPTFEPLPEPADTNSQPNPKVSGTPGEFAAQLALAGSTVPTTGQLGAPPWWANTLSVIYIGGSIGYFVGLTAAFSLAAIATGIIIRFATPFAARSQARGADIRERSAARARSRLRGAAAEIEVGNRLSTDRRFDYVLHAKMFGPGDVDHTVVGPCFATIETKSGGGPLGYTDGKVTAGTKQFDMSLLEHAQRDAARLTKIAGVPCTPVVCIDRALGVPRQFGGVWVCGADHLGTLLASFEPVCADNASNIYNRLVRAHRKMSRRRPRKIITAVAPTHIRLRRELRRRAERARELLLTDINVSALVRSGRPTSPKPATEPAADPAVEPAADTAGL